MNGKDTRKRIDVLLHAEVPITPRAELCDLAQCIRRSPACADVRPLRGVVPI